MHEIEELRYVRLRVLRIEHDHGEFALGLTGQSIAHFHREDTRVCFARIEGLPDFAPQELGVRVLDEIEIVDATKCGLAVRAVGYFARRDAEDKATVVVDVAEELKEIFGR